MSYTVRVTRSGGGAVRVTRTEAPTKVVLANSIGPLVATAQQAAGSAEDDAAAAAASAVAASNSAGAAASSASDAQTAQSASEAAQAAAETAEGNAETAQGLAEAAQAASEAAQAAAEAAQTGAETAETNAETAETNAEAAQAAAEAAQAAAEAAASAFPVGGTTGQFHRKASSADYDTEWHTLVAADVGGLATVATSGAYSDLTGTPTLGTIASQDASSVSISGGSIAGATVNTPNTGLSVRDPDGSHSLAIVAGSNLSADRTFTILTGNASRNLTMSGNADISGTNTGDQTISLTGDVTGSGTGSFAATIAADAVTNAKLADMAALSVKGNATNASANPTDITAANDGEVLRRSGTSVGFGTVATAGIANDAVTYAKLQNVSATSRILGRKTASAGDPEECTLSEILDFIGSAAQGDILYRGASGWARLAAGTALQVLQTGGASANPSWATAREVLTGARTYYVRTDGSDSNTGLVDSAGGAFLTLQKAINVVAALDIGTNNVTIQVRSGTYTAGGTVSGPWVGSGTVTLVGDTGTPSNVVISTTNASCVTVTAGGRLTFGGGFKLQTTTTGSGLFASRGGVLTVSGTFEIGACATAGLRCDEFGTIQNIAANYSVTGGGQFHWYVSKQGLIDVRNRTITITGTPAFSAAWAYCTGAGYILCGGNTFSGSATGSRYNASELGNINTQGGGATYLPGNAGGTGTNPSASPYGYYQ